MVRDAASIRLEILGSARSVRVRSLPPALTFASAHVRARGDAQALDRRGSSRSVFGRDPRPRHQLVSSSGAPHVRSHTAMASTHGSIAVSSATS